MMKTLAIVNQKGGVGKTTSAVTIAHGLAMQGKQVLLVDLDAQGNCADALGEMKRSNLYDLLINQDTEASITCYVRDNLDAVFSDKQTVEVKGILSGRSFREYALRNALEGVVGYDLAIFDCAPGADILQINALIAADYFIIPVSLAHLATVGAVDVLGTVSSLQKVGAFQGSWLGVLPTMWDRTTNESQKQLTAMVEHFGRQVFPPIPLDVKARECPSYGKTLFEYAPTGRALTGVEIGGKKRGGYEAVIKRLVEQMGV